MTTWTPIFALQVLLCLVLGASAAWADDDDEVDPLALAARLLDGGHPARAASVLADVDDTVPDDELDKARLYTLRGVVALQLQDNQGALDNLEKALRAGAEDVVLHRYAAYAAFALGNCKKTLGHIKRAQDHAWNRVETIAIRSECLRRQQLPGRALNVLRRGQRRFVNDTRLLEREVAVLVEHQLFQEAFDGAARLVLHPQPHVDDPVENKLGLVGAFLRAGAAKAGVELAEMVHLQHFDDVRTVEVLGHAYAQANRPLAGAQLFAGLSFQDASHTSAAVELYRRAGRPQAASWLLPRIADRKERLRQRLGLLLEEKRYEEAAALAPKLKQTGLLDDDQLLYALAFAEFSAGRHDAAERHARAVKDPAVFRQATDLMQAIGRCKREASTCL